MLVHKMCIFRRSLCFFFTLLLFQINHFYNAYAILCPTLKQQPISNKKRNIPFAVHRNGQFINAHFPNSNSAKFSFAFASSVHTAPIYPAKIKQNCCSLSHNSKFPIRKGSLHNDFVKTQEKDMRVLKPVQTPAGLSFKEKGAFHESPYSVPAKIFERESYPFFEGVHFIEILCSNPFQSAFFFQHVFGFQPLARCGLDTGNTEKTTYVLKQGNIHLLLTSAFDPNHPYSEHTKAHGDGVYAIGLATTDAEAAYHFAIENGAISHIPPRLEHDEEGEVTLSSISLYGDTKLFFVDRKKYRGTFLPGFWPWHTSASLPSAGLENIDHVVANVEKGKMKEWCTFFHKILNFRDLITFDDKDISTAYTALASTVVSNVEETVTFPINEPADGLKVSQIQEFLEFYKGPGCQHIALTTNDIVSTVKTLRSKGCEFLSIPSDYYTTLPKRIGPIDESLEDLQAMNLLVDRDEFGYMIQTFTKPLSNRPTFFFEIIQRKGAKSFGKGNFKALFESVEAEQRKRGTLEY